MLLTLFTLAGGTLGATYSWATSVYSYNRDAWMTDITILQNHDYQYDNMQIATHQMSRDQVRDRTEAAITKLNNYILVTTLIIALAGEMLVEGQIPAGCADFVLNVYMLSLGSAILYLALGALFGVAASNVIYESSADLLTVKVPPPWASIDGKMRDREEHKMTQAFERRPFKQIFMPPLFRRAKTHAKASFEDLCLAGIKTAACSSAKPGAGPCPANCGGCPSCAHRSDNCGEMTARQAYANRGQAAVQLGAWGRSCSSSAKEDGHELEKMGSKEDHGEEELTWIQRSYEEGWSEKEGLWAPLFDCSRKCVAVGLHSLLEAYGYLCMATLYGEYGSAWAFWAVQIIFISLNVLITMSMFDFGNSWIAPIIVAAGPISCGVAATTPYVEVDRILVPVCYLSHFVLAILFSPAAQPDATKVRTQGLCESSSAARVDEQELLAGSDSHLPRNEKHSAPARRTTTTKQEQHSLQTSELVSLMVFRGGIVVRGLWLISVVWAIWKGASGGDFKNNRAVIQATFTGPPIASTSVRKNVSWPSPYFRPKALVCPPHHVFLADEFRIFELDETRNRVTPYPCDVNASIADLTSACDEHGCWPVALLTGVPPMVYDCKRKEPQVLLQAETAATRFASRGQGTLYVAHGRRVLQYNWSPGRQGWTPQWAVVEFDSNGPDAMDVSDHRLLLFRTEDNRTAGSVSSVEILNLHTGKLCSLYELPPALMGAGCAEQGGNSVQVLAKFELSENQPGPPVQLMRAELEVNGHDCPKEYDPAAQAAQAKAEAESSMVAVPAAQMRMAADRPKAGGLRGAVGDGKQKAAKAAGAAMREEGSRQVI